MNNYFLDICDTKGVRHLVNLRYIEEIVEAEDGGGCWIHLAFNCPNAVEQDYIRVNESFETMKILLSGGRI